MEKAESLKPMAMFGRQLEIELENQYPPVTNKYQMKKKRAYD